MAMSAVEAVRPITRQDYARMGEAGIFEGERVELVLGIVRRRAVIGTAHAYVVGQLTAWLVPVLLDRADVRIHLPVAAGPDGEPEPDVAVCPPGLYLDDHPHEAWLVIEVAQSSLKLDRGDKAVTYAAMGVPEYWIVNLVDEVVEVHRAPGSEGYATVEPVGRSGMLTVPGFPEVTIPVSGLLPDRKSVV